MNIMKDLFILITSFTEYFIVFFQALSSNLAGLHILIFACLKSPFYSESDVSTVILTATNFIQVSLSLSLLGVRKEH